MFANLNDNMDKIQKMNVQEKTSFFMSYNNTAP